MRWNLEFGIDDLTVSAVLFFLSGTIVNCLCVLPMTVLMSYIIPRNIEASMFALVTAAI